MNILYMPLEFPKYFSAKKMTYPVGVGMCEGFANIDFTVVPLFYNSTLWGSFLQQIVMGQEFDQIWLEVVHSTMSPELLEFIHSLAPVTAGFVIESLTIHPDEYVNNPVGTKNRESNLAMKSPYLTHVVVTDERDLQSFNVPTLFEVASVPKSMIHPSINEQALAVDKTIFFGTPYGERSKWIDALGDKISVNPHGDLEEQTGLNQKYQTVVDSAFHNMQGKSAIPVGYYKIFCNDWMTTRKQMYHNWINILNSIEGFGVLNPPHRTAVLSARVIEAMAAGKVVFSHRMQNGADFLFNNGENILYYESLEELEDLIANIDYADKYMIAQNAINTVLENHTTEKLVQRVLKFVKENS